MTDPFDIGRALNHGVEALKREPAAILVGSLLTLLTGGSGGGGGGDVPGLGSGSGDISAVEVGIFMAILAVGLICGLLMLALNSFLTGGWLRVHARIAAGERDVTATLFSGSDVAMPIFGFRLLQGLVGLGIVVVAGLPAAAFAGAAYAMDIDALYVVALGVAVVVIAPVMVYVQLGLIFGAHAIALDGQGVMEAFETSWALASGRRIPMVGFAIVMGLVNLAGVLLCCLPLIPANGVTSFGWTEAYLIARRGPEAAFIPDAVVPT